MSKWALLRQAAIVASIAIASTCLADAQSVVQRGTDRLLALPEEDIDVGIAALTLTREVYPDLDIQAYSKKIDALAAQAREIVMRYGHGDPDSTIRALNTFFFRVHGLHYDPSLEAWEKQENFFLAKILDAKEGTCANMPVLYMAVAQRLGLPIHPVSIPEHQFLRYVAPGVAQANIEATGGGGYIPDERYIKDSHVSMTGLARSDYLKTLTKREWLAHMIDTTAVALARHGRVDRALKLLELAVRLNPKCAGCYHNLGATYLLKAKQQQAPTVASSYARKAQPAFARSHELGYVAPFTKRADNRIRESL